MQGLVAGERRDRRKTAIVILLASAAMAIAMLQLPARAGAERPEPWTVDATPVAWIAPPPRLAPESPPASAVLAETDPPASTTTTPPTTAPSTTTPPTTTPPAPVVPRPERIRALVHFPFEQVAPSWHVSFEAPRNAGLLGLADPRHQTIRVFLHPDASDERLAFTLAHEMGHALDALHVTPDERREYRDLRGISQRVAWQWPWDGSSIGDRAMPAGDFAESFALATTGIASEWASRLGPPPSLAVQARVVEMATAV